LAVWGTDSDVLSEGQARRMVETLPKGELLSISGVGHAPSLVEPTSLVGLERFLGGVLTRISHAEEARLIGGRGEELASWRCSGLEGKRHSMDEGVWRNAPRSC
jgi:hypothetical protein